MSSCNKSILITESSSGSLVSCLNFNSPSKAYVSIGMSTDSNPLSYQDLNYVTMSVPELKDHLLDLLTTLQLYEKGFYNEDHVL